MYIKADGCGRTAVNGWAKGYTAAATACLVFGAVYELFSHGVWSAYMLGAWTLPALCAAFLRFAVKNLDPLPGRVLLQLQACGAATLTAGSLMKGVLDIYGTTNGLTLFYPLAGGFFILLFALLYGLGLTACRRKQAPAVLSPEEETNIINAEER